MRKKIIILILFFLFLSIISYFYSKDDKINYTLIGEKESFNMSLKSKNYSDLLKDDIIKYKKLNNYNKDFLYNDIRIIDLINIINLNKKIDNRRIQNIIKNSDIILLSIGNDELYYKLNLLKNEKEIYNFLDRKIVNINNLMNKMKKITEAKIIFIGYYNTTVNSYNDKYFRYLTSKIDKKNIIFIDLIKILTEKDYDKDYNTYINEQGNFKIYKEIKRKIINNLKK